MTSRILIVDYEPELPFSCARLIPSVGHKLLKATSGAEGLCMAKQEQPDLILLNVELPDRDGCQACRQIKTDPDTADIYVALNNSVPCSIPKDISSSAIRQHPGCWVDPATRSSVGSAGSWYTAELPIDECPIQRMWESRARESAVMPIGDRWSRM